MMTKIRYLFIAVCATALFSSCGKGCSAETSAPPPPPSILDTPAPRTAAPSGSRFALVIGNGDYANVDKLKTPVNDAQDIASALSKLGFVVEVKTNADRFAMTDAVSSLIGKLSADPGSEGFFWYAGHGMQARGENYLLPVDVRADNEDYVRIGGYPLKELIGRFDEAGNRLNVAVIDACRDSPIKAAPAGTHGLRAEDAGAQDLLVIFSSEGGNAQTDEPAGKRNGPYAEAFLRHIDAPEALALMSLDVARDTLRLTEGRQRPFASGGLVNYKGYSLNPSANPDYPPPVAVIPEEAPAPPPPPRRAPPKEPAPSTGAFKEVEVETVIAEEPPAPPAAVMTAEDYYRRAVTHYNRKEYDAAIADCTEAERLDPKDARFYYLRGRAYLYGKGDYNRAIDNFNKAVGLAPDYSAAYYERGYAYSRKNNDARAIADYSEAIKLGPDFARVYYLRGRAYQNGNIGHARAIADYTDAVRLDPKMALAYNNRGLAHNNNGDYNSAIADYDAAIKLDPKFAVAYSNRGLAYNNKEEYDRAISDYTEAITLDPKFAVAYSNRGLAYNNKGEYDQAIADCDEALKIDAKLARAYSNRGLAYSNKEEYDRAIADYDEAIRLDPKFAVAYSNRSLAYSNKGEYEKAIEDYSEAVRLDRQYENEAYIQSLTDKAKAN